MRKTRASQTSQRRVFVMAVCVASCGGGGPGTATDAGHAGDAVRADHHVGLADAMRADAPLADVSKSPPDPGDLHLDRALSRLAGWRVGRHGRGIQVRALSPLA